VTEAHPTDRYLGQWELVPELCLYQHGEPPTWGIYDIQLHGDDITIAIQWGDVDGATHEIGFASTPDGIVRESDAPGITHFSLTRVSELMLDSAAIADGRQVAYARRAASPSGDLLTTVQTASTPDGVPFSNFQVYRRTLT
jgi:hypothetical protein